MTYTRREFGKIAAATLPAAAALLPSMASAAGQAAKPNSKWAGVQVGMNVPYNYGDMTMTAQQILAQTVALGISAVEMRGQPIEAFLGAPPPPASGRGRGQDPAVIQAAAALRKWRESASIDKARDLRRTYEDAGVLIEIVKWDGIFNMSDGELDYVFQLSKSLGAKALSTEISGNIDNAKRVGQFADKHQLFIGYHGHASTGPAQYAAPFALAKFNGANVDIGHFVAGNNTSPVSFITQHAERITHLHIKDRKMNDGANTPFGEGDTPIKEVLQLMRDRKYTFQATVEFEYPIPEGSTRLAELAKAIDYCKNCLLS